MAPGISLDDRSAWDDSALITSWDDASATVYTELMRLEVSQHCQIREAAGTCGNKGGAGQVARVSGTMYVRTWTKHYSDYGDLLDEETLDRVDLATGADATDSALPPAQTNGGGQRGPDAVCVKVRFDILTGYDRHGDQELTTDRAEQHPLAKEAPK
jgi:hypothetical protein